MAILWWTRKLNKYDLDSPHYIYLWSIVKKHIYLISGFAKYLLDYISKRVSILRHSTTHDNITMFIGPQGVVDCKMCFLSLEKKKLQSSTKPMTCKAFYYEDFLMNNLVKNFLNFSEILSWLRMSISSSINGRPCLLFFFNFIMLILIGYVALLSGAFN